MKELVAIRAGSIRAARLAALVAIAGFFAMHGLAVHSTAVGEPLPVPAASTLTVPEAQLAAAVPTSARPTQTPPADPASGPHIASSDAGDGHPGDGHGGESPHSGLELCLAALVLAVVLLLCGRVSGGVIDLRAHAARSLRSLIRSTRLPRPPDLHGLSILRC